MFFEQNKERQSFKNENGLFECDIYSRRAFSYQYLIVQDSFTLKRRVFQKHLASKNPRPTIDKEKQAC